MLKRFLDCNSSDFFKMNKREILDSIKNSEGRIIVSEIIGMAMSLFYGVSNAELSCAFGSDILLLNMFDIDNPSFFDIKVDKKEDIISEIKMLTGRLIGVNLEPVDSSNYTFSKLNSISKGRLATKENAKKLKDMGADFIFLTGNPNTGVTNKEIIKSLSSIKEEVKDSIILVAGKMHSSGIDSEGNQNILTKKDILEFSKSGADIILLPAPGTVPGITLDYAKEIIDYCHSLNLLTITSIGTSQEGADESTLKNIALMCKMAGTDLHHLGDSGYTGICIPENIMHYSIAIRGKRHTYMRMARSINR
ncbi:haloacid dehalogenase-like hydrolase [Haloimpatiens sp. FM7315]|uniref:DUF7916 family protein n=1 Tax=Haloimpatiens sp. FM7315 TaxID=3298609 RepID=UPI00370AAC37